MLVPVRQALSDAREHQAPYYRTDHHWTSFGAFTGYQAWAASLGLDSFKPSDFQQETVSDHCLGTIHSKLNIPQQGNQFIYGKQDLFSVVIAFRYLLPKDDFLIFKRKLTLEISKVNKNLLHITEDELLKRMGFPQNWKNISRYRLTP